jgi:hypothetical protein
MYAVYTKFILLISYCFFNNIFRILVVPPNVFTDSSRNFSQSIKANTEGDGTGHNPVPRTVISSACVHLPKIAAI